VKSIAVSKIAFSTIPLTLTIPSEEILLQCTVHAEFIPRPCALDMSTSLLRHLGSDQEESNPAKRAR
jgi:hypothetical protein